MMKIRVLLVEDFPLVREGVAAALRHDPAIEVVGEAGDGREGLLLAQQLRPDVVVLDLHMPEIGGMMLLERLQTEMPEVRTIIMTASEKGDPLLDAVAAGASGYLTKRSTGQELRQAVVTVHGGPAVQVAELRPDPSHTSFVAGVMRMNPKLIRGELRPVWKAGIASSS